jgi:hypothetical protein
MDHCNRRCEEVPLPLIFAANVVRVFNPLKPLARIKILAKSLLKASPQSLLL